jgi:MFS family permease
VTEHAVTPAVPDPTDMVAAATALRRAEREYNLHIRRNLTPNYIAHLFHGMLGQTGFKLLNAPTFLPAYIMLLSGGSNLAVGLALSLQSLGMMLTPLIGANVIEYRRRVLPVGFVTGGGMRAMILCIALAGLYLSSEFALVAILLFLLVLGLFQGMQGVIFNVLMAKVIPVRLRGRLTGMRNFLAGIISAALAWVAAEYFLGEDPTATGYSYTFFAAFVLTTAGLLCLIMVREPQPPTVRPRTPLFRRMEELPALLRTDPAFTKYFLARALATTGRMALPFYIIYAGQTIGLTGQTIGVVSFAFLLAATVSNLVWGMLADRLGFRAIFLWSIVLWVLATVLLMASSGLVMTAVVFAAIGAAVQGFQNASANLTLEFGHRDDLPVRIAIANTTSEFAGTIGPLLGGILATALGYGAVFVASMAFLAAGAALVIAYVPEPRFNTVKR